MALYLLRTTENIDLVREKLFRLFKETGLKSVEYGDVKLNLNERMAAQYKKRIAS